LVITLNSSDRVVPLRTSEDILRARQASRELAVALGFGTDDHTRIATAVPEIARNVLQHSGTTGEVRIQEAAVGDMCGVMVTIMDSGCGIADLDGALADNQCSLVIRRGAGLPGSKRLMDEFHVDTAAGKGTTVRMVKWLRRARASGS
jgi:serine/threonine-protein kinase RsbT